MSKVNTIKYGSVAAYATVPARLMEFRNNNPRAQVTTEPMYQADGSLIFKAEIVSDLSDASSSRATGHARYDAKEAAQKKAFEKLETIATGRALALLGYLNNGDVATSEEMAEFEQYKLDRVEQAIDAVKIATSRQELAMIQASVPPSDQKELNGAIRERIKELSHAAANK